MFNGQAERGGAFWRHIEGRVASHVEIIQVVELFSALLGKLAPTYWYIICWYKIAAKPLYSMTSKRVPA